MWGKVGTFLGPFWHFGPIWDQVPNSGLYQSAWFPKSGLQSTSYSMPVSLFIKSFARPNGQQCTASALTGIQACKYQQHFANTFNRPQSRSHRNVVRHRCFRQDKSGLKGQGEAIDMSALIIQCALNTELCSISFDIQDCGSFACE